MILARAIWLPRTSLRIGRHSAAGAALGGKIYVVGGHDRCDAVDGCSEPLASIEIYDPATDQWTIGPPMHGGRSSAGAAMLGGKLYVAGGGDVHWPDEGVASVEMFDPMTGRWTDRADLPARGPVQLVVMNGTLYAVVSIRELQTSRLYAYDATRDAWTRLRDPPVMLYGAAVAAVGDGLYAIGGYSTVTDRPFVRQISNVVYVMRR